MSTPLVYFTCVLILGVIAQWFAWRFKLPAILLLLATGFAMGRVVVPEEIVPPAVLSAGISLSVAVILFEGGLSLRFRDLAETGPAIFRLVTVGCVVTWILACLAGRLLIFETWSVAALAGAIFTVTGPTVIGPLLRHVRPHRRVAAVSRWEGIVIDPIGATLAVLVYETIISQGPESAAASISLAIFKTILAAVVIGGGTTVALVQLLRRHWLPDFLHAPTLVVFVLGAFTLSDLVQHESGLATVTLLGIALANQKTVIIEHIAKFKEALGVLLLGALFIVLSGRLHPDDLIGLGWGGLAFVGLMILLVRPVSVLAATGRSALNMNERLFLSWLAPRGVVAAAVSGVFALQLGELPPGPLQSDAMRLVPTTFLLIVMTVTIYGLTAKPAARRLGVADPEPQGLLIVGAESIDRAIAKAIEEEGIAVKLVDTNRKNVTDARLAGLRVRHGNILADTLRDDLDLSGLGRLLAVTSNDEVNSLAAISFTDIFDRANVFQLPTHQADKKKVGQGGENRIIGRRLFSPEATYEELDRRLDQGAVIKKTVLTQEFDYTAFRQQYGGRAIVMFVVSKNGKLQVCTADDPPTPVAGQKLISLIDANATPVLAQNEHADQGDANPTTSDQSNDASIA